MVNRDAQPVSYRPFRADPLLPDGLLGVAREGGDLERRVADAMFRVAREQGIIADRQAERAGQRAGEQAALATMPRTTVEPGRAAPARPGQPYKVDDPAATDLPVHARAFLNAVSGGESGGSYNVRYTPQGPAFFDDLSKHPKIFEDGPHGKTSAAGRYQFVSTTWDSLGGGDFSPANQDRQAWKLAQRDYRANTGRNLDADLQQGGLTPQILKVLTPTWQAFKSNQDRHIATYQESFSRYSGQPANAPTVSSTAAPQVVATMPEGARFDPSGEDTIFGRAYDAAGTRTFLQALDLEIRSTTEQAYEQHKDDPTQLNQVLDTLKAEQLREHVPDEIRAEYETAFETVRNRVVRTAAKNAEKRIEEANFASFQERSSTLATDVDRHIEGYDPDIPETEAAIHSAQTALDDHYDTAVANGTIRADQAAVAKVAAHRDTAVRFYGKQAEAKTPDGVRAFREQLAADYAAGGLDGLDAAGWQRLDSSLQQLEARKVAKAAALVSDLDKRGSEMADRAGSGFNVSTSDLNRFVLDAGESQDAESVAATFMKIEAAEIIRNRPLAEAQQYVAGLRQKIGDNPTPAQISAVMYAEERLGKMSKLIATDAAGYAIATGQVALKPIDMADLDGSLALRRDQMEEVAARYDSPLTILRPAERATLARALVESPDAFPQFALSVQKVFGAKAATVLAEISEDAPVLAHAAGLSVATGDNSLAVDLAQAISAKQQGQFKVKMPAEDKFVAAASPQLGTALAFMTRTRSSVMSTAALVFERDANLYGFDPSKVGEEGSEANLAMRRAVDRALGAQVLNGEKTGGVAEVNGAPIVAPTGMPATRPQRIINTLSQEDLAVLPPIRTANGVEVTARQLRGAQLVTVGDGLYRVALGDPLGFDPQFVMGASGDFWTLDMNAIDKARLARPSSSIAPFGWNVPGAIE